MSNINMQHQLNEIGFYDVDNLLLNLDIPEICFVSKNAYDKKIMHGIWLDCYDTEYMQDAIDAMLSACPLGESEKNTWMIYDCRNWFDIPIQELHNPELEKIVNLQSCIQKYGDSFIQYAKEDIHHASKDDYLNSYMGVFVDQESFVIHHLFSEKMELLEQLRLSVNEIKLDRKIREVFQYGDFYYLDADNTSNMIYVFRRL